MARFEFRIRFDKRYNFGAKMGIEALKVFNKKVNPFVRTLAEQLRRKIREGDSSWPSLSSITIDMRKQRLINPRDGTNPWVDTGEMANSVISSAKVKASGNTHPSFIIKAGFDDQFHARQTSSTRPITHSRLAEILEGGTHETANDVLTIPAGEKVAIVQQPILPIRVTNRMQEYLQRRFHRYVEVGKSIHIPARPVVMPTLVDNIDYIEETLTKMAQEMGENWIKSMRLPDAVNKRYRSPGLTLRQFRSRIRR